MGNGHMGQPPNMGPHCIDAPSPGPSLLGGPCVMRSNVSWVMVTWDPFPTVDSQTDTIENIIFPQLRRRAVKICEKFKHDY